MNHNYNKNNVKTKGLDPPKPITVQSYKISQRQKWKCCQAWRLIWVSETYRDILLYLWGAAFPLCCCDLGFFFSSQLLFQCVSVIKVWLALFRRAQYEVPHWSWLLTPLTSGHRGEGKPSLYLKFSHAAICLDLYLRPTPPSHLTPPYLCAPTPPLQLSPRLSQTGSHRPKHIKDTAHAQHMN